MHHLGAFADATALSAGVLVAIAAVQDETVFTSGTDLRVPNELPFIVGEAATLEATTDLRAQIQSPSLRRIANLDIQPYSTGTEFASGFEAVMHPSIAIPMVADEAVNCSLDSANAAVAVQYGFVWFGDGPQQQVTGDIFTIRATAAITQVANSWTNGNLTFAQDLPVGNYDIVGLRVVEANTTAARMVFIGGKWRPGCIASVGPSVPDNPAFRHGRMGIWGTFHTNTPPTVDFIGAAGAQTPEVFLDLIARG